MRCVYKKIVITFALLMSSYNSFMFAEDESFFGTVIRYCAYVCLKTVLPKSISVLIKGYGQKYFSKTDFNCTLSQSTFTLNDYIGEVPKAILQLIDQIKNPEKYQHLNIKPTKGILLFGMPGTGKTLLAKAIAGEIQCPFYSISAASIRAPYQGQSEESIREMFKVARLAASKSKSNTAVIFIDEIDGIGSRAKKALSLASSDDNIIQQLLTEMDGFSSDKSVNIVVIAATNRRDGIDDAITRSGRFDYKIEIHYPNTDAREKLLDFYTKKYPCEYVARNNLAMITAGMSCADIEALIKSAARNAAYRGNKLVQPRDIAIALIDNQKQNARDDASKETLIKDLIASGSCDPIDIKELLKVTEGMDRRAFSRIFLKKDEQGKITIDDLAKNTITEEDRQKANQMNIIRQCYPPIDHCNINLDKSIEEIMDDFDKEYENKKDPVVISQVNNQVSDGKNDNNLLISTVVNRIMHNNLSRFIATFGCLGFAYFCVSKYLL